MSFGEVFEIGVVEHTGIAPVKGMQFQLRDEIELKSASVVGDRRIAFTREQFGGTPPSYLVSDRFPDILKYAARFADPTRPTGEIIVTTPEGSEFSPWDKKLWEEMESRFHQKVSAVEPGRNTNHSMPVSIMATATLEHLQYQAKMYEEPLDVRRFRENVVIRAYGAVPCDESNWLDRYLIFGNRENSAQVKVKRPDQRCRTVSLHPETGEEDPRVLSAVANFHGNYLGVYGNVEEAGKIRVGDKVYASPVVKFRPPLKS